jgi:hypothetical protein
MCLLLLFVLCIACVVTNTNFGVINWLYPFVLVIPFSFLLLLPKGKVVI